MFYFTKEEAEGQKKTMACPGHMKSAVYLTSESQALAVKVFAVTQLMSQKKGSGILLGDLQGSFEILRTRP